MKIGFVFGVRLKKYNNNFFSINLPSTLLQERYLLSDEDEMVLACRYSDAKEDEVANLVQTNGKRISVKAIPDPSIAKRILALYKEPRFIEETIADCDVVICRGYWGVKACQKLKKKYLVEVVSCTWDAFSNHGVLGKINAPFAFLKARRKVKNAPYVVYVTNEFLQRRYPTRGQSIGISDVALTAFDDSLLEQRRQKIHDLYESDRKIVIGTAAAVNVKYKGQWNVIEALSILKKKGKTGYRYIIAGGGDQTYLMDIAAKFGVQDQIEFVGSVVKEKMPTWYDSIDVYIQPSLQEGLPRSLIEAMSRGLPALGSRTGGIPELLQEQYVCRSNRCMAKQLAEMLLSLDENQMVRMSERNYEESKKYDAKLLLAKRTDFLQRVRENK